MHFITENLLAQGQVMPTAAGASVVYMALKPSEDLPFSIYLLKINVIYYYECTVLDFLCTWTAIIKIKLCCCNVYCIFCVQPFSFKDCLAPFDGFRFQSMPHCMWRTRSVCYTHLYTIFNTSCKVDEIFFKPV